MGFNSARKHSESGISSVSLFIPHEQRRAGFSTFSTPISGDESKINNTHTLAAPASVTISRYSYFKETTTALFIVKVW